MSSGVPLLHGSLPSKAATAVVYIRGHSTSVLSVGGKNKKVGICEFDGFFEGPRYRTSGFNEWPIDGIAYRPKAPQFEDHHRHFHLLSGLQCVYGCPPVIRGHHRRGGSRFGCSLLQMSKDLQGAQWAQYDQDFREWAAAIGIRQWGELNFTIYGRCLATTTQN